jgi:hypothetical protein
MWAPSKATLKGSCQQEGSKNHAIAGAQLGDAPAVEIVGYSDIGLVESHPIGIRAGGERTNLLGPSFGNRRHSQAV